MNESVFLEYLWKIKKNSVILQIAKKIDGKTVNLAVFDEKYLYKLGTYKTIFLKKINTKREHLVDIRKEIFEDVSSRKYREILLWEIDFEFEKMTFLELTYDIAAQKLHDGYKAIVRDIDYEHYNKIFWNTSLKDIDTHLDIIEPKHYDIYASMDEVLSLLEYAKSILPVVKWKLWDFPNLAFNGGWLKIPNVEQFHIKDVLALFFHEFTHLFRFQNGKRNLWWLFYSFSDYNTLEEGMAIYNEFFYANQVIDYGVHNPFYDKCFQYLLSDLLTEEEKLQKITELLAMRGYDVRKSKDYYDRFYKFAMIGSKHLYLKDLVYTKAYNTVKELLEDDPENYDKMMAGRVGVNTLKLWVIEAKNNLDSKSYYEAMVLKLQEFVQEKEKNKASA